MSSWFDVDYDIADMKKQDIEEEIWADTFLSLAPKTLLWEHLRTQDLKKDSIKITLSDLYAARTHFINCGYPLVYTTFNKDQLIRWLDDRKPFISRDPMNEADVWVVDMNRIANVDELSDHEIALLCYNEQFARDFLTFVNLGIEYYKIAGLNKLAAILPMWYHFLDSSRSSSPEEIKKHVITWKHVPSRYQKSTN